MSALGQKQTFALAKVMSALPPKADMCAALADVCKSGHRVLFKAANANLLTSFKSGFAESIQITLHRFRCEGQIFIYPT
jgi:hypothetical protein